jgi:pyruvate dehydrogenase E2 component (dihydrolipoamide acetyltransferase)/putative redox protein
MGESLQVSAAWQGGYAAVVRAREHELRVDEPERSGGEDSGPMPTELFCGALASCFCLALGHVAAKRELELGRLIVTVDGERVGREPRYGRLRVNAQADTPQDVLEALVERAKPLCWVSNMLAADIEVDYIAQGGVHAPEPS